MTEPGLISVFTPSHQPRFLDETLNSLLAQHDPDWEWVVLLNGNARWRPLQPDRRVRVVEADDVQGVGAAKRRACSLTRGDILVELDHDDLLVPEALARVRAEFAKDPDASLVYSDTAHIAQDGSRDDTKFDLANGWEYDDVVIDGRALLWAHSFEPTPHNVSYIWFAPNHVRAFRRTAYESVGGYDASRHVLDDQDLMCRLYQAGPFRHIPEVLYLQRMYDWNTQRDQQTNAFIQEETVRLYDRYIEGNALAWCRREGLHALDFGAAHNRPPGYLGVDQYPGEHVDVVATLPQPLDLPDNSCGVIRAYDFLEHVVDKVAMINEIYRLLAPGGLLLSMTPSTDGRGAFQDPTHVAFYNENSFWYYTEPQYRTFVPGIEAKFQSSRLTTLFPSEWHQRHNISYVYANLIALKDGMPRNAGVVWF